MQQEQQLQFRHNFPKARVTTINNVFFFLISKRNSANEALLLRMYHVLKTDFALSLFSVAIKIFLEQRRLVVDGHIM